jgi:hypothetical protein
MGVPGSRSVFEFAPISACEGPETCGAAIMRRPRDAAPDDESGPCDAKGLIVGTSPSGLRRDPPRAR